MHKSGKWLIRIAVTGILFLLLFSGACAAAETKVTAGCPGLCGAQVVSRKKNEDMVLCLPGCWDLSRMTLEIEGMDSLLLGEERIPALPGEPVDLTEMAAEGKRIIVRNGSGHVCGYLVIRVGSRIPSLFLEVDGKQLSRVNMSKKNRITEGRAVYVEADGTVSYDGALTQLKGRGTNTFSYSKKPYQLKLAEKASLSGMGRGKAWILLANWVDVSMLRNQIVLDICREAGLRNAVGCVQADVWINGSYHGLYLVTEKIQIGKGRIDITNLEKATEKVNPDPFDAGQLSAEQGAGWQLLRSYPQVKEPEDVTGGYIFTVEKHARLRDYKVPGFRTNDGLSIHIKEPTYPGRAQTEYLCARVSEAQKALLAEDGINPDTGKSYEEYLDVTSFAKKLLIEDWCKNYDLAGGSQYLYKDSDGIDPLIYAGPAWDYDLCFGNMKDRGNIPQGEYATSYHRNQNLYWLLYQHEAFRDLTGLVWQRDFKPAVEVLLGEREAKPDGIVRSLDEYVNRISASVEMNYKRWPVSHDTSNGNAGQSFDNAVRFLRNWITIRSAWMNETYRTEIVTDED